MVINCPVAYDKDHNELTYNQFIDAMNHHASIWIKVTHDGAYSYICVGKGVTMRDLHFFAKGVESFHNNYYKVLSKDYVL